MSPRHLRNRGFALAWTAIVISTLLLIVGLSIDVANLLHNLHQLQNATDAAALAGAKIVKIGTPDDTRQFTRDVGFANKAEQFEVTLRLDAQPPDPFTADENAYDILIGRWVRYYHTFVPTLDAPNAVRAYARRNTTLGATDQAFRAFNFIFGPLAGVETANASTLAVAWAYDSGGAGLICLSEPVPGGGNGLE
ncbi:MAG: pilus assembly protein TadG-related protein, partial [Planctomycetota bacterium]